MTSEHILIWRGDQVPTFRLQLDLGGSVAFELPTTRLIHMATHLKNDFILQEIESGIQVKMEKIHSHKFSHIGFDSDSHTMYVIDKAISMSRYAKVPEKIYRQIKMAKSPRKTFAKYISRSYRREDLI